MKESQTVAKDLRSGDVVRLFDDGPYGVATVKTTSDTLVRLIRPFVYSDNAGVGIEVVDLSPRDTRPLTLLR